MDVGDGEGLRAMAVEDAVQAGLGGGLAVAGEDAAIGVDFEQVGGGDCAFVEAAGGDEDALRGGVAKAEIAGSGGHPAAVVALVGEPAEGVGLLQ